MSILVHNWWVLTVRGVLAIGFGILAVLFPVAALLGLVYYFGAYAFIDGIFALISAIRGRPEYGTRGELVAIGLIGIAAGIALFAWPGITLFGFLYFVAGWSVLRGIWEIATAIELRKEIKGEGLLIVAGLASIIFGVLIGISPVIGLVAVGWLFGFYSFLYGGLLISLGSKMKQLQKIFVHPTPTRKTDQDDLPRRAVLS